MIVRRTEGMSRRVISPLAQATAGIYAGGFVMLSAMAVLRIPDMSPRWMLSAFASGALVLCLYAVARGDRLRPSEVTPMAVATMAMTVILSWNTQLDVAALANGATLPIMALYIVWFLPSTHGRVVLYSGCASWWVAIALRGDPVLAAIAVVVLVQVAIGAEVLARVRTTEHRLAHLDVLTGAVDRTGVAEACERHLVRLRERGTPFSVISMDLDGLREVNNQRGHHAGDALLVEACQHWRTLLREHDLLGRIGGDEFVIVLPGSAAIEAMDVNRRLRIDAAVAWSAGVAQARPDDRLETLLHRADERMYRQKAERASGEMSAQPAASSGVGADPPRRAGTHGTAAGCGP